MGEKVSRVIINVKKVQIHTIFLLLSFFLTQSKDPIRINPHLRCCDGHRVLLCCRDCVCVPAAAENWGPAPENDVSLGAISVGRVLFMSLPGLHE